MSYYDSPHYHDTRSKLAGIRVRDVEFDRKPSGSKIECYYPQEVPVGIPKVAEFHGDDFATQLLYGAKDRKRQLAHPCGDSFVLTQIQNFGGRDYLLADLSDGLSPDAALASVWPKEGPLADYTADTLYAHFCNQFPNSVYFKQYFLNTLIDEGRYRAIGDIFDISRDTKLSLTELYLVAKKAYINNQFLEMQRDASIFTSSAILEQYLQAVNGTIALGIVEKDPATHTAAIHIARTYADTFMTVGYDGDKYEYTRDDNLAYDNSVQAQADPYFKLNRANLPGQRPLYASTRRRLRAQTQEEQPHIFGYVTGQVVTLAGATDGYRVRRDGQQDHEADVARYHGVLSLLEAKRYAELVASHTEAKGELQDDTTEHITKYVL